MTSAPMLVAEAFECDRKKVHAECTSPQEPILRKRVWGDMESVGSFTLCTSQDQLRNGGAAARKTPIAAAAQSLASAGRRPGRAWTPFFRSQPQLRKRLAKSE